MEGNRSRVNGGVFLIRKISLLLFCLALSVGARADMAAGIAAYQAGDFAMAMKEFKPLAAKGNADAQVNLGFLYARGQGVAVDYKEAASWYRKAAEQGQPDAQFNLGSLYYDGLGLARDFKKAAEWYSKAAEQGQIDAQYNLGLLYATGQGVLTSLVQAHKWLSIAAALGDKEAEDSKRLAEAKMSREQVEEAQALAQTWWAGRK